MGVDIRTLGIRESIGFDFFGHRIVEIGIGDETRYRRGQSSHHSPRRPRKFAYLWALIGKLIWRSFGTQKNEYCVSRLMAFDAEIIGTWGCLPRHYPKVLEFVLNKAIEIKLFTELRPMSRIREVFEKAHSRKLMKRVVLTPNFWG